MFYSRNIIWNYILVSRLGGRPATADAVMSSSFHGTPMASSHMDPHNQSSQLLEMTKSLIENFTNDSQLMTQSLDPAILGFSATSNSVSSLMATPTPMNNGNLYNEQSNIPIVQSSGPLITASIRMMPVPETLMSPECGPALINQPRTISSLTSSTINNATLPNVRGMRTIQQQRPTNSTLVSNTKSLRKTDKSSPSNSPRKALANTTNAKIYQNQSIMKQTTQVRSHDTSTTLSSVATTEDEDEDDPNAAAGNTAKIRKVAQKSQKQLKNINQFKTVENKEIEKSAILIQKLWRGYSTRKKTVREIAESIQQKRTQEYIVKLTKDMEMTKQALENERKIQQLQMYKYNFF